VILLARAEYRYDASGARVMTITPTATTYHVFGAGEYSGGVWTKLYFSMGAVKLLEYSNGNGAGDSAFFWAKRA
jgi:hypothetical protein